MPSKRCIPNMLFVGSSCVITSYCVSKPITGALAVPLYLCMVRLHLWGSFVLLQLVPACFSLAHRQLRSAGAKGSKLLSHPANETCKPCLIEANLLMRAGLLLGAQHELDADSACLKGGPTQVVPCTCLTYGSRTA